MSAAERARGAVAGWPAVSLAVFTAAWGGNEFTPLLVMYRTASQMSAVVVDALLFLYVLGIVPALLVGGPLSDRLGRRALMLPSPVIAAAGSILLALGEHSVPLLAAGRVLSGVALGLAMAVGGTWIKELSDRAGDPPSAGARRAALSLTAGFGVGAGLAAVLAQWAPLPGQLSYLVNVALAVASLGLILRTPETRPRASDGRLRDAMRIPSAMKPRFWLLVAPVAPWVFGACAMAYAVIPAMMTEHTPGTAIAFAGLCCVAGLTAGFFIQTLGKRIDRPGSVRTLLVALGLVAVGMALAIVVVLHPSIALAVVTAIVLGCGYGMALISCLMEVQRLAGPDDLAGLTAVFYTLTYLGFASPAVMAWVVERFPSISYPEMFGAGIAMTALGAAVVSLANRTRAAGPHTVEPAEQTVDLERV
ncbi:MULTISPECIES: MFS transporter [Gordonia]|uniref:Putative major facilitator superfamily transporter n=1 Tax=Gordonia sihwensis NBRC 108236 TaxID=1223544 RepID=L7LR70_9ACTN|nr:MULTISPECIES: MFS transporter [Gordonia]AUH67810.1 MFS transporter [Gordonia sp. YC-JH1]GAC62558.1 putative major facilitator superfamily transporter [Gordonia sihwensis NBRC 108236]